MAYSAGCNLAQLQDPVLNVAFPLMTFYPSTQSEEPVPFGPYLLSVAMDAAPAPGSFPLVLISHGSGGSHLTHRNLAAFLARNGFVVALPEHPFNNRNNNQLAGTAVNLLCRPGHLRLTADWAFSSFLAGCLVPRLYSVVGHSLGGYTALAAAGGIPVAFPNEIPEKQPRRIDVVPDPRVQSLVLLAPAAAWFQAPGALQRVTVPILMLTAEHDPHTPEGHAEIVRRGLPGLACLEHRVIAGAGHFSFLSPFPTAMVHPAFPPSQDPPGFDRSAFHEDLNTDICNFLRSQTITD